MLNITMRRKARQFSKLIRHSAITPRTGQIHKPVLASANELGLTFIGHSSFFVQLAGKNLLIDPNFANWLFVLKRLRRPGTRLKDLPAIDAVLVTHAHFDHLHRPSLRAIARHSRRKSGKRPAIFVSEHIGDLVADLGFSEITEMRWWEQRACGPLTITHTPASHWGARVLRDFHRGWGGYALHARKHSVYHAGDTAYFNGFHEIGARLNPQIALLPIGAYNPPSFRNVHMNPEDALRAFADLNADVMIPMHYGTFRLSHEPMDEPLEFLDREAQRRGVRDRVLPLSEGMTQVF